MNRPNPALVTQRSVQRLPRWMLLLFCAAYVVPGVFGRDPWRNQDLASFGVMSAIAEGRVDWLRPTLGGLAVAAEPLPYWLGAAAIWLLSPVMDAALAARLPFAALLALTLAFSWYACFHLARTQAAQPVAFAFGGEADPVDYARAMADGCVLALMASLGLLQLGHETTPELMQLFGMSVTLWALAAAPFRELSARFGILAGLLVLAGSGAPSVALLAGVAGWVICLNSSYEPARRFSPWPLAAMLLAAICAWLLESWAWRAAFELDAGSILRLGRQWLWFLWPAWLFAAWTLWRWRRQWRSRHVTVPTALALVGLGTSVFMGGNDRALLLALPGMAVLAAFALPTMKRSVTAAIDWFSVFAATAAVLFVWAMYVAMQTGWPEVWRANINRLQPGVESVFSPWELAVGLLGTGAWVLLVRWRTGRSTQAMWKTLVLPASGVALSWLLVMSLWLPRLDYARSARPLIERGLTALRAGDCIAAPDTPPALVAALEIYAKRPVIAGSLADGQTCNVLVTFSRIPAATPLVGWRVAAAERRNRESSELMVVYHRLNSARR
jgi:4-amino-4-deoxy-L-arabinose transferase-like glycosyltransferase